MSRANELLKINEIGTGTAIGITRTALTAARLKQKMDDKVRQVGLGNKLDKARLQRRVALKKRLSNPLSKQRKEAHIKAKEKVSHIKDVAREKYKKMTQHTGSAGRSELM